MRQSHSLLFFTMIFALAGCVSSPVIQQRAPYPQTGPLPQHRQLQIDVIGLQNLLGMNIAKHNKGYFEKQFNTCAVGYGYPSTHNCALHHFVVVNFQLLCRQSEGTVSETIQTYTLPRVSYKAGRWTMQNQTGTLNTDAEGMGQIVGIFSTSQRNQRLKLAIANDFLYARAGEMKQVLTPTDWCR